LGISTYATGINDSGDVVGTYYDSTNIAHGFILSNGVYTTIGPSGAFITGINNLGQITGYTNSQSFELSPPHLFSPSKDRVNFNTDQPDGLSPDQQAAIANGADIYHGLGGNDVVTLPSVSNYTESVGNGKTLNWQTSSVFDAGDKAGDAYTINGGDGTYKI